MGQTGRARDTAAVTLRAPASIIPTSTTPSAPPGELVHPNSTHSKSGSTSIVSTSASATRPSTQPSPPTSSARPSRSSTPTVDRIPGSKEQDTLPSFDQKQHAREPTASVTSLTLNPDRPTVAAPKRLTTHLPPPTRAPLHASNGHEGSLKAVGEILNDSAADDKMSGPYHMCGSSSSTSANGHPLSYPMHSAAYHSSASSRSSIPYNTYSHGPVPIADPYRSATVTSNPTPLPSMRTIDLMAQQPVVHPASHHSIPLALPPHLPPGPADVPLYVQHGLPLPGTYGFPPEPLSRYTIPQDPRLPGNRGLKKEIKRRTKTGCLTCRKRRIKCDEAHPTCNNCKKSKRECLGYDPIFKPAAGSQSTVDIQSTTGGQQRLTGSPLPSNSSVSSASVSPSAHLQHRQPAVLPSSYSSASPYHGLPATAYDPVASSKIEASHARGSMHPESSYRYPPPTHIGRGPHSIDRTLAPDQKLHQRVARMKVDEILQSLGPASSTKPLDSPEDMYTEVVNVYHEMYAAGLSAFFETSFYYFTDQGKFTFPKNKPLVDEMAQFLQTLEAVKSNDYSQMTYSGILETRLVWRLASVARQPSLDPIQRSRSALPPDGDPAEAHFRQKVVDALLCGDSLDANPLTPPYQDNDPHRSRQFDFWHSLAEFVRERDPSSNPADLMRAREEMINRMRHLLDGRENRDVLYSIAVVRELAPRFDSAYSRSLAPHLDESDPKHRLAVASKFIVDQAQVTGGTTNVVRRLCDIAARAFVNPGVNIARDSNGQ